MRVCRSNDHAHPTRGKFVSSDDAVARFEGTFPPGRVPWLKFRIFDVENALMGGDVPSLRKTLPDIIEASAAAGDPDRVERVKQLVVDKVLGLYRNPDGATQVSQTMEQDTTSRSYGFYQDPPAAGSPSPRKSSTGLSCTGSVAAASPRCRSLRGGIGCL